MLINKAKQLQTSGASQNIINKVLGLAGQMSETPQQNLSDIQALSTERMGEYRGGIGELLRKGAGVGGELGAYLVPAKLGLIKGGAVTGGILGGLWIKIGSLIVMILAVYWASK